MHRFQTQMQILGDLRGGAALAKKPKDLQLAIAQAFHRRTRCCFARCVESAGHAVDNPFAYVDSALEHATYWLQRGSVLIEEFLDGPEVSLFLT